MKKIIFTEEYCQPENLHPFTLTRQIQDIRVGILTIREKWERHLKLPSFDKWEDDYKDLDRSIRIDREMGNDDYLMIHGNILPNTQLIKKALRLKNGEFLSVNGETGVIFRFSKKNVIEPHKIKVTKAIEVDTDISEICFPWDIFKMSSSEIVEDYGLITSKRKSARISKTNKVIKSNQVFIEKGASVENSILNAEEGPIYIGKNVRIMDGCMIRGPFSIGEGAVLKMGTKIYGGTSIGPYCIAGGEIKNSVLFGYSNKAHDGYLGDSVIGEWCNIGAGTSNSNLKNNVSEVRIYTPAGAVGAGLKCGLLMGDYSRCAINTSFNTGTVVGVSSHVFGSHLTPKYIPSFSWGSDGVERYQFDKAINDIAGWKALKGGEVTENEKTILRYIFENY